MASDRRGVIKKLAIGAGALIALVFAVQGGEYSTFDLLRQRRDLARINRSVDSLQHTVDSLRLYETAVRTDPALQERLAREIFGMVRGDKELLYRFADSIGSR